MEFFTPWMLLGLGAIAIPVLIHLFNRKSAQVVQWGAFMFLRESMVLRRRRLLLEEVLLLATRCLLFALLALVLARPFIKPGSQVPWSVVLPMLLLSLALLGASFAVWRYPRWRIGLVLFSLLLGGLAGGAIWFERDLNLSRFGIAAERDVVLVIDGSSSMTLQQGGESNFERARKEAELIIKQAARGTAFGLIVAGPVPQVMMPAPVTDRRELFQALDRMRPVEGLFDAMNTFTAAALMLASGSNPGKQIIVLGDGQSAGWYLTRPDRWKSIAAVLGELPTPPKVLWRTFAVPASFRNVGVTDIRLGRDLIGTDREVPVHVVVSNTGSEVVTPEMILFTVEGVTVTNRSVAQLEPGAQHTLTFKHRFSRAGAQCVRARVVSHDDLAVDDTRTAVVSLISGLRTLIVEGNADVRSAARSSRYLALALRPEAQRIAQADHGALNEKMRFLIDPEIVDVATIARREGFSDCSVVVLSDVPSLPAECAERISRFVANGGGVLIVAGPHCQRDFYATWKWFERPLVPLVLEKYVQHADESERPRIDAASFSAEHLARLKAATDLECAVAQHWQCSVDAATAIQAKLSNGDPFLALHRVGRGFVALATVPFDAVVSALPVQGSFVPLVHELIYCLANPSVADLNIQPADGATILLTSGNSQVNDPTARGLQAIYYQGLGFQGRQVGRVDTTLEFNWEQQPPIASFVEGPFSVRWSGALIPKYTDTYEVWVESSAKATLRIEGVNASDRRYALCAGQPANVTIELEKEGAQASIKLMWRCNRVPHSVIPKTALIPYPVVHVVEAKAGVATQVRGPLGEMTGQLVQTTEGIGLRLGQGLFPGEYTVDVPERLRAILTGVMDESQKIPFYVQFNREEGELATVTVEDLAFLRTHLDLQRALKFDDVQRFLTGETFGKEIWRMLAYAVLICLVLEIVLTRWIAIQRRTGQTEDVTF